jgi:hypothetical protein
MTPIQIILVVLLVIGAALYFSKLRSLLLDRLLVVALIGLAIAMIVKPGLTTRVANWVGVGRGVDLIFYLTLVGLSFVLLILYSEVRTLQSRLTELTRAVAIANSRNTHDSGHRVEEERTMEGNV